MHASILKRTLPWIAVFALATIACVSLPEFFLGPSDAAVVSDGGIPIPPNDGGFDADDGFIDTSNGDFLFFVTSLRYPADFGKGGGALADGTSICMDSAKSAGLKGSFKPFLWQNDSTGPMSVVPPPLRERAGGLHYHQVFTDGGPGPEVFAYDKGVFVRAQVVILNEKGFPQFSLVWTGGNVLEGGTDTCFGWSRVVTFDGGPLNGTAGTAEPDKLSQWDYFNTRDCKQEVNALYCIQVAH